MVFALCFAAPCQAALGADLASVQADQQAWAASATQADVAGSTLHTQALPEGLVVRQYVDTSGRVFAVAWSGPVLPDFARLLGTYYAVYADAVHRQKRSVSVRRADVVMESGGMMRAFHGRAYLPALLPFGLTDKDVR